MSWINLLAPKEFLGFTPEEFKAYVRSLKIERKSRAKKPQIPFRWKLTPKGNLSVIVNRRPRWISREEIAQISRESKVPENEVWIKVLNPKAKNPVRLSSVEEEKTYVEFAKELPR